MVQFDNTVKNIVKYQNIYIYDIKWKKKLHTAERKLATDKFVI